jgi:hypothetical protein
MGLTLLLALAVALQGAAPVRFHHAHYLAADPSAAISTAAARLNGTRTIVSGLGVGVRTGGTYALFDRSDDLRGDAPQLDHVAFAAADFDAAVAKMTTLHTVLKRGPESVLFDAGGIRLEIVRDTQGDEIFWCPMHPDVRSAVAGKCPLCAMDLVPIPPPRIGEYRLDIVLHRAPRRGLAGMQLTVREPDTNKKVTGFATLHEKTFHLFIVSRDLAYFAHVHPEPRPDGTFVLKHAVPPGEYMVLADFLPNGGSSQMVQRAIISPGARPAGRSNRPELPPVAVVDGIRFELEAEDVKAGGEACLTFTMTDAKTGASITDLEPFLGAPAHMLIVRADLTDAIHGHPEETGTSGPTVTFHPLMPADGLYKIWVQVQRSGKVITAPFRLQTGK